MAKGKTMANRWMQQFFFSLEHNPVYIDGQFTAGSSGAVSGVQGSGISGVTKLATGVYRIELQDQYYKFLGGDIRCLSTVAGGDVNAGSFNTGSMYRIKTLGNTNWVTAGMPTTATAAVGDVFCAAAAGSGTGVAEAVVNSGIVACEIIDNPNPSIGDGKFPYLVFQTLSAVSAGTVAAPVLTMNSYTPAGTVAAPVLTMNSYTPAGTNANDGPPETFTGTPAVLTGTNSAPAFTGSAATLTKAHPQSGSIIRFNLFFRNSSVKGKGE